MMETENKQDMPQIEREVERITALLKNTKPVNSEDIISVIARLWNAVQYAMQTRARSGGLDVEKMADAYEEERAKYLGGTVYYPNNGAAFKGCMQKAIAAQSHTAQTGGEENPAVFYCENGKNLDGLEQGALAVLSNLMMKTNATSAEFMIGNEKDGEFHFTCHRGNKPQRRHQNLRGKTNRRAQR